MQNIIVYILKIFMFCLCSVLKMGFCQYYNIPDNYGYISDKNTKYKSFLTKAIRLKAHHCKQELVVL